MKTMKRFGCLLLVVAMCLALGVSAMADTSSNTVDGYSITIENTTAGKQYSVYQILDATYSDSGSVSYTIEADSIWLYTVQSAAGSVFTLTPVYKSGYTPTGDEAEDAENVIRYYVEAAEGVSDDDIIAAIMKAITMVEEYEFETDTDGSILMDAQGYPIIVKTNDEDTLATDSDGNTISTGLAVITAYDVDEYGNIKYEQGKPVTKQVLLLPEGTNASDKDSDGISYSWWAEQLGCGYTDGGSGSFIAYIESAMATETGNGGSITITVTEPGYYFITTTTGTTISITTAAPNATIIDKNIIPGGGGDEPGDGTPWLDKYIVVSEAVTEEEEVINPEDDEYEYDYAMGNEVSFHITSDVPLYADSNKSEVGSADNNTDVNNAEKVYEYVFTDSMSSGISLKIETSDYNTYIDAVWSEYKDGETTVYTSDDKTYCDADGEEYTVSDPNALVYVTSYAYLSTTGINEWITLTDGTGASYSPFTSYAKNCTLVLSDFVAVYKAADYETSGKYTTNKGEALIPDGADEPTVEYYAASGFTLTYYTYDVDAYDEVLSGWIGNEEYTNEEGNMYTAETLPAEAYEAAWEAAYTNQQYKYPATAQIAISYTGVMTDVAVYDNTNTVTMDYYVTSWDAYPPYNAPEDENPTPGSHSGQTVHNDVFTWELNINKVDSENENLKLEGAIFTLQGQTIDRVKVTTYTYTLAEEVAEQIEGWDTMSEAEKAAALESLGYEATEYYLAADGEYVTEAPAEDESNANLYDSENPGPYYRMTDYVMEQADGTEEWVATGTTDADGSLSFSGLKEGTYTLTEVKAPDGYNLLSSPIYFEVKWYDTGNAYTDIDGNEKEVTKPVFVVTFWEASDESNDKAVQDEETELYWVATTVSEIPLGSLGNATCVETVENTAGTLLPSTGGIGTTIFYVIGAVLVCGAVVLLVTKRRVNNNQTEA